MVSARLVLSCLSYILSTSASQLPSTCKELYNISTTLPDDYYWLSVPLRDGSDMTAGKAIFYCHSMTSGEPLMYLPLPAGPDENFSNQHDRRSSKYWRCDLAIEHTGHGYTEFTMIRIVPPTAHQDALVIPDDFQFSQTLRGTAQPYGQAADCMSMVRHCHQGEMRVNLTGTGFIFHTDTTWQTFGYAPAIISYSMSGSREAAHAVCGGWRGGCRPNNWRLQFNELKFIPHRNYAVLALALQSHQVHPRVRILYDIVPCQATSESWDELYDTLALTDGDFRTCATLPDPLPVFVTYRLNLFSGEYLHPVTVTVTGDSLGGLPGGIINVLTSERCEEPSCFPVRHCVQIYTGPGDVCAFKCRCDKYHRCANFYVQASLTSLKTLCEIRVS